MPSKILVTSNSNLAMVSKYLPKKMFKETIIVSSQPTKIIKPIKNVDIYAVGGGSVIDVAKMLSGSKPCFACPTNASGAVSTSHACVWGKEKIDVKTAIPILIHWYRSLDIKLDNEALERTKADCLCHIFESKYSYKATEESQRFCEVAEYFFGKFVAVGNISYLIDAGISAGRAIEITGTNFIHAISYVISLKEGLCHGDALREALHIRKRKDGEKIIQEAAKKYPKFYESTLV